MSSKPWLIGKALRNPYRAFCCYSNVSAAVTYIIIENKLSKQQTTLYSSIHQLLIVLQHLAVIQFPQFCLKPRVESCDT